MPFFFTKVYVPDGMAAKILATDGSILPIVGPFSTGGLHGSFTSTGMHQCASKVWSSIETYRREKPQQPQAIKQGAGLKRDVLGIVFFFDSKKFVGQVGKGKMEKVDITIFNRGC